LSGNSDPRALKRISEVGRLDRNALVLRRAEMLAADEVSNLVRRYSDSETEVNDSVHSIAPGLGIRSDMRFEDLIYAQLSVSKPVPVTNAVGEGQLVHRRKPQPRGPLAPPGGDYDYFSARAKASGMPTPRLFSYRGLWGSGEEYAYEVLNFANGNRNAQQVRDAVSAEYGPVPLELVVEYLKALEKIGVVERVK
jgi:hypothetical protein